MPDIKKEFEETLKKTDTSEQLEQEVVDNKKVNEIFDGEKEVYIRNFGTIVFRWPDLDAQFEGDDIYARYMTKHLLKEDLLTRDQLKKLHIEKGAWTEREEAQLEDLPDEIQKDTKIFSEYREQIQELKGKKQTDKVRKQIDNLTMSSFEVFKKIRNDELELLKLNAKYTTLFSYSIEERANFERVKYFAPLCIFKKDEAGEIEELWKNKDEMLASSTYATKIIGLFVLFLRGADVSFFGDMQEEGMF